ncbi:MAG: OmpA family protein [Bacteroidales bacterium]|jgi:outer membrane protein OmpA-like peptidoglycan-associated protein|nr:OmpA family protein [Bacteroidales bacterium]
MNRIITFMVSIALSLSVCISADAQARRSKKKVELNHEISLYGAGGLSNLSYRPATGDKAIGFGIDAGLGYTYFIKPQWGIGTGAGIAVFNASTALDGFKYELPDLVDYENDVFVLHTTFDAWKEKQRITTLMIPLMLTYRSEEEENRFYVSVGGKAGFPLAASYRVNNGAVTKKAHLIKYDSWAETQQFMGFGSFTGLDSKGTFDAKPAFFASVEAGMQWKVKTPKNNLFLYVGAYLDYGLNPVTNNEYRPFLSWDPDAPRDFNPSGIVNARLNDADASNGFTDKVTPVAAGLKLRLAFGIADHVKEKRQKQKQQEEKRKQQAAEQAERQFQQAEQRRFAAEEIKRKREEAERQKLIEQQQLSAEEAERQRLTEQESTFQRLAAEEAEISEYRKAVKEIERTYAEFTIDQIEMNPSARADLDKKIELLQRYPNMHLLIEGHTCNIGGHAKNVRVGQRRADYAKQYLVNKGVAPERIIAVTKAETEPLVPNASENNRRKNRRIEIKVVE